MHSTERRALFLDRDGVINVDRGYVHQICDFEFIEGIFDLAREAFLQNYRLVVITNQAGIGRGFYTEAQFQSLSDWMCNCFLIEGAPIDKVYFSPYHPTEALGHYKQDHPSRKPNPGMFLQAQRELGLDLKQSVMIGDKLSDIQASSTAGIGTNLLLTGHHELSKGTCDYSEIPSLKDAIPFLRKKACSKS